MKIDKHSSKPSKTKLLMKIVIILCPILVIWAIGRMAFPENQNEIQPSWKAEQNITGSTQPVQDTNQDTKSGGTVISVESVTIPKGTDVATVNIQVANNPGIMGAILKISVDDQVFGFDSGTQIGFPGLTLTSPGPSVTSSPYIFMMDAMELSDSDRCDGTLFAVTFKVKDADVTGEFEVSLSYEEGAIFDEEYIDLDVTLVNGTITIE